QGAAGIALPEPHPRTSRAPRAIGIDARAGVVAIDPLGGRQRVAKAYARVVPGPIGSRSVGSRRRQGDFGVGIDGLRARRDSAQGAGSGRGGDEEAHEVHVDLPTRGASYYASSRMRVLLLCAFY